MKKTLLLAVVAVCSMTANAQIASGRSTSFFSTEKSENPISFGVRAGINLNSYNVNNGWDEEFDATVGLRVGVVADIPIFESLYFEPGLYYANRSCKYTWSDDYESIEEKHNPSYLELPLLLQYRYNFSDDWGIRVNFGPYFAYALGGKAKEEENYNGQHSSSSLKLFSKENDFTALKRFDFGLMTGIDVAYRQFSLGIGYQAGLAKINKDWAKNYKFKNSGVYIQLGYNF
ncbi:MAG: PorT family protein [Bacteroidaceae bacterium]|nr:PorT family protein [Bacteroidaceae bacterium]